MIHRACRPLTGLCLLAGLLTLACDDGDSPATPDAATAPDAMAEPEPEPAEPEPDPEPEPEPDGCQPDEAAWSTRVLPLIETWCGDCHGETPQFGAPYGLLDYGALLAGEPGARRVDALVAELRAGTMPPPAFIAPTGADRAALLDWATCGANTGAPEDEPLPGGFDVDRPLLDAPADPPEGTDFFELRADAFPVGPDVRDRYECFTFAAPIDTPRLIRRVETIVDDGRVLHHTVLIPGGEGRGPGEHGPCRDDNPLSLIYGWAPGQGPLHFPEGGIRIAPGERLTLQVHYNNAAGHTDVRDSSGVRIHHGPVEPGAPIYDMLAFGPTDIRVAPRSVGQATGYCVLPQDVTVFASFPHMHEAGVAFEQTIERADGTIEPLITLSGWSFDSQYLYQTPVTLSAGDLVTTTCTYRNLDDRVLRAGSGTADEMCFNFAYVTPPLAGRYCNRPEIHTPAPYTPGRCAPPDAADVAPPRISGSFAQGEAGAVAGGALPESGRWRLESLLMVLSDFDIGVAVLDPDASQVSALGLAWIADGRLTLDAAVDLYLTNGLLAFDETIAPSVSGALTEVDAGAGTLVIDADCGDLLGSGGELNYEVLPSGGLRLQADRRQGGLRIAFDMLFVPLDPQ